MSEQCLLTTTYFLSWFSPLVFRLKLLVWHSHCVLPLWLNASMLCFSFSCPHIFLAPFSLCTVYYLLEECRESGWYGQWLATMAARRGVTEGLVRGRSMEATRAPVKCFLMLLLLRYAMLHYGPAGNLHKANTERIEQVQGQEWTGKSSGGAISEITEI